jgi:enamine deaminase RidA (YjgF/YER057c/UK114 family)
MPEDHDIGDTGFKRVFTGTPWEPKVGYCRAVRAGNHVYVSGCAPAAKEGGVFAPGDAYAQTRRCIEIAMTALQELGGTAAHVVRTRMFVTDISRWQEYGQAHGEVFAAHPPVSTMVEVKGLVDPAMLVEVEVDAYIA